MTDFDFNSLTPEQKEKAKGLKTREDVLAFIEEQNIDLTQEQLDAISGGTDYADILIEFGKKASNC